MGDNNVNLPPGFRFYPTDEELVVHFLHRKATLLPCHPDVIPDLDLYPYDPWELDGILVIIVLRIIHDVLRVFIFLLSIFLGYCNLHGKLKIETYQVVWTFQAKLWQRVTSGTSIAGRRKTELQVTVIGKLWAWRIRSTTAPARRWE